LPGVVRRLTLIIEIQYRHPDPQIAAKVANYFAQEYLNYVEKPERGADQQGP